MTMTIKIPYSTVMLFYMQWNEQKAHSSLRLGQAFYDFIQGHKVVNELNKDTLDTLYNATTSQAHDIIESMTDFN